MLLTFTLFLSSDVCYDCHLPQAAKQCLHKRMLRTLLHTCIPLLCFCAPEKEERQFSAVTIATDLSCRASITMQLMPSEIGRALTKTQTRLLFRPRNNMQAPSPSSLRSFSSKGQVW